MMILNAMKNNNGEISDAIAQAIYRRTVWAHQFNASYDEFIGFLVKSGAFIFILIVESLL